MIKEINYIIEYTKDGNKRSVSFVGSENWNRAVAEYWNLKKREAGVKADFFKGDEFKSIKLGEWVEIEGQMLEPTMCGKYVSKMPKTAEIRNSFQRLESGIEYQYMLGVTTRGGSSKGYITRKKSLFQNIERFLH